jgi:hypothetical protein
MRKLLALICLAASIGCAETIVFNSLPGNQQFGTNNGYLVATIDGEPGHLLVCDDFSHTTYVPSGNLIYDVSTLTGTDPLEYARFSDSAGWDETLAIYQEAAHLLDGLSHTGPGYITDLTAYYQYAIWHLFTPSTPLPPGSTTQTLLNEAAAAVARGGLSSDLLYSRLRIYTPGKSAFSNQEFLELVPAPPPPLFDTAAPEPSPAVLVPIGLGLVGLSYGSRRLLRRSRVS